MSIGNESASSRSSGWSYAPFAHSDTEHLEAFRLYAQHARTQLEGQVINCAVDSARATLEALRFSTDQPLETHTLGAPGTFLFTFFVSENE